MNFLKRHRSLKVFLFLLIFSIASLATEKREGSTCAEKAKKVAENLPGNVEFPATHLDPPSEPVDFDDKPHATLEGLNNLLRKLDPKIQTAAKKLLESGTVKAISVGGMGFTFVLEDNLTHKKSRYKIMRPGMPDPEGFKARFEKEIDMAIDIGNHGIGPKSQRHPETGFLQMEEIEGKNLEQWIASEAFKKMDEKERTQWIRKFTLALASKIQALHDLGYIHIDLKPSNIMVVEGKGKDVQISLVDFGLSLKKAELEDARRQGEFAGTPKYHGGHSLTGDFNSLRVIVEELFEVDGAVSESDVFKNEQRLRAVFSIFSEPLNNEELKRSYAHSDFHLLQLALKESPTDFDRLAFWNGIWQRLDKRTSGQKLKVLFSDPLFNQELERLKSTNPEELKKIIDEGMIENRWRFNRNTRDEEKPKSQPILEVDDSNTRPELTDNWFRLFKSRNEREKSKRPIDFKKLRAIREQIGKLPEHLVEAPRPDTSASDALFFSGKPPTAEIERLREFYLKVKGMEVKGDSFEAYVRKFSAEHKELNYPPKLFVKLCEELKIPADFYLEKLTDTGR